MNKENLEQYLKATDAVKTLLTDKLGSHSHWSDERFLEKVLRQYPMVRYEKYLEGIRSSNHDFVRNDNPKDYISWILWSERWGWQSSLDAMGPGGLDHGYYFDDFHEERMNFDARRDIEGSI